MTEAKPSLEMLCVNKKRDNGKSPINVAVSVTPFYCDRTV
jgi:hypothetical protein